MPSLLEPKGWDWGGGGGGGGNGMCFFSGGLWCCCTKMWLSLQLGGISSRPRFISSSRWVRTVDRRPLSGFASNWKRTAHTRPCPFVWSHTHAYDTHNSSLALQATTPRPVAFVSGPREHFLRSRCIKAQPRAAAAMGIRIRYAYDAHTMRMRYACQAAVMR